MARGREDAAFAAWTIDAARWPRTAALVERVWAREAFRRLAPFEERMLRNHGGDLRDDRVSRGDLGGGASV